MSNDQESTSRPLFDTNVNEILGLPPYDSEAAREDTARANAVQRARVTAKGGSMVTREELQPDLDALNELLD